MPKQAKRCSGKDRYGESSRADQRVMASTGRFLERRLRLQVNEEKSKVARPEEIHFLGFRLPQTSAERSQVVALAAS